MKIQVKFYDFIGRFSLKSIIWKMIIGYIAIIFIPVIVLGYVVYNKFYNDVINEYRYNQRITIEQSFSNINGKLKQIEGTYQILQTNTQLEEWLNGDFTADSDIVYNALKYIIPLFNYASASNTSIGNIKIYKMNQEVRTFKDQIVDISELPDYKTINENLTVEGGYWCFEPQTDHTGELKYYRNIYNNDYTHVLGVMELSTNIRTIENYLYNSINRKDTNVYFLSDGGRRVYEAANFDYPGGGTLENGKNYVFSHYGTNQSLALKDNGTFFVINMLKMDELNMSIVVVNRLDLELSSLKSTRNYAFIICFVLLVLLSTIYYYITYTITGRITRLSKHMKTAVKKNFPIYRERAKGDEISDLVESYNSMIGRIDELVNKVYRAEMLRKEAAYSALSAQVKPHFIYNILETIRMLAETHDDTEVADICFKFSKLIRYSITDKKEVTLRKEIDNIELFLDIHKIRLGHRLEYNILVQADIDNFSCPWFLIQPIVENSIVHGISQQRKKGYIDISVIDAGEYLRVIIKDNGKGIPQDKLEAIRNAMNGNTEAGMSKAENAGIGLANVNERLKEYFGREAGLYIKNIEDGGTLVEMHLIKTGG